MPSLLLGSDFELGLGFGPLLGLFLGWDSLPCGQDKLLKQYLAWAAHDTPQKFVFNVGALDGDEAVGRLA